MSLIVTPPPIVRPSSGTRPVTTTPDIEVIPDAIAETREHVAARYAFAVARLSIGFVFLWAFLDKLVGLDHATPAAKAWINGGSPTTGFLNGVKGPFGGVFGSITGTPADWLFMAGLLGIGIALTLASSCGSARHLPRSCTC